MYIHAYLFVFIYMHIRHKPKPPRPTASLAPACEYEVYTGWPRPIGCLIILVHFPQLSLIISGIIAERDPAT